MILNNVFCRAIAKFPKKHSKKQESEKQKPSLHAAGQRHPPIPRHSTQPSATERKKPRGSLLVTSLHATPLHTPAPFRPPLQRTHGSHAFRYIIARYDSPFCQRAFQYEARPAPFTSLFNRYRDLKPHTMPSKPSATDAPVVEHTQYEHKRTIKALCQYQHIFCNDTRREYN